MRLWLMPGMLALTLAASGAVITPTSYTLSPAPNSGYPDTGGTELTDGVLAAGLVNNPATDGVPYVAWQDPAGTPVVTVTFQFSQTFQFTSVEIGALRSDFFNFAGLPTNVDIAGQDFIVAANALPDGGRGFLSFNPVGLVANSVTIEITPRGTLWLMLDEVRFNGDVVVDSGVPEPSSVGLMVMGLLAIGGRVRRGRRAV